MNNFEDIKNKNIQEMAEWIEEMFSSNPCYCCIKKDIDKCHYYEKNYSDRMELCVENRRLWLESEADK